MDLWIGGYHGSPNDAQYSIDNTWNWEARGNAIYDLPKGFRLSAFYRQASGAYRGPSVEVLNVEGAKVFTFREHMHFELNAQVFNLMNGSGAVTTNWQTTTNPAQPTFGVVTSIESARVARIGARFSF